MAMRFNVAVFFPFLFFIIASRLPFSLSADIPGFIYIDCGASKDSIDSWGLPYKSDKDFIESGESKLVAQEWNKERTMQHRSLRSFPEGERNCYTVKLEENYKNKTYLVRGVFVYGNYDGKNNTPVFDLYIGVNRWTRVDTDDETDEMNYVPTTNYIQLCLVNIGNGIPYISALEIRRLDASIYPVPNGYLTSLWKRRDIGGSDIDNLAGYPDDISYDRFWSPLQFDEWNLTSTKEVIPTSSDDLYKVPQVVLATASLPKNSSSPLNYIFTPSESGLFYFCLHFVEIEKHKDGQFREMRIVLNNDHIITPSIKLDYLKRHTICSNGINVTDQDNYLSIYSTPNSKLPPILNALEVFYSTELTNSPTFLQDVNAIMDIKQSYKVRKNWQGDPCIPTSYIWDGLNCTNVASSRIISLNLSSSNLTGDIALSFSNLTQLESLDLSNNDLSGPIPENFARLLNLKILNLTGNNLTGIIPEALLQKSRNGILLLSVNGNPELCLLPPCKEKKKFAIPVLAYIISGIVLFILIVLAILMIIARKRKQNSSTEKNRKGALKPKNRPYSFSEVTSITNNFKTTIGEGGFGKVLGTLNDNTLVAVKLLSPTSTQGYKEFQAEAQLLMIVYHQNLVSLVGYCDEGDKRVLIYEYMPKGNLQQHLSEKSIEALSWIERVQIAIDAAHGLDYLHNGCKPPIIHRDLKPANILLDDELRAKIADFGLSRFFTNQNESQILTNLAGTLGYVDPEYQRCGKLNKKSDTYSFGIILFELITGKPALTRGPHGNVHILEWVAPILNRGDIQNIVDMRLEEDYNKNSAWKMVEIAVFCTQPTADQRPDMSYVLEELKACWAVDQGASTGEYSSTVLAESDITPSLRAQTVQLQERNERLTLDMSTVLARLDASERALLESERERREFERSMKATVDSLMAAVQGSQGSSTSGIAAPRHEPLPDLE